MSAGDGDDDDDDVLPISGIDRGLGSCGGTGVIIGEDLTSDILLISLSFGFNCALRNITVGVPILGIDRRGDDV